MGDRPRNQEGKFTPVHGAYCQHFRKRYSDARTREGKQLRAAIQSLIDDLGGKANITGAQSLLLDNIRSKLIVLFQIGKFVDREADLINEKGELVSCLNRNFLAFSEGLRRDLEALARMAGKASSDVPDLGKYIEAKYATKGKS